ncbi:hypothetical protein GBAR_LOCUS29862 [Geodia barretti]|uniref:Uncharacterized protein n=1 Tax=Geodia barretti TaxID=519541 RepID=A0AA35XK22_GEOBA|nr:hypothetical protein GBAR_LOCUS29862 [Geodia barretti]
MSGRGKGGKGLGKGGAKRQEDSARQHPGHHQVQPPPLARRGRSQAYLWPHLRGARGVLSPLRLEYVSVSACHVYKTPRHQQEKTASLAHGRRLRLTGACTRRWERTSRTYRAAAEALHLFCFYFSRSHTALLRARHKLPNE